MNYTTALVIRQTPEYANWFDKLRNRQARARIDARIRRLQLGNPGDVKPVGQGISELRIHYGVGYRVYFATFDRTVIVLLAGGDKSTQDRDITNAKRLAKALGRDHGKSEKESETTRES